ncbi:MAG: hemerythrin domain-containing protein [Minicystis sp.]
MQYDRMLAELFGEEDRAREMASRLADTARSSPAAAAAERDSLLAFLRGPVERHFRYEEEMIFPHLEEHDLGPEVQVAIKQHDSVRQMAQQLAETKPGDDVQKLIFEIARLLLHHTNFEGDYIYPELTHDEWRQLMKQSVERDGAASKPRPGDAGPGSVANGGGASSTHATNPR